MVVKVLFTKETGSTALSSEDVWAHLQEHVRGTHTPFTDENVAECTDWDKVKKYYKLNGAMALKEAAEGRAKEKEIEMLVLGAMALRGL